MDELRCDGCGMPLAEQEGVWTMIGTHVVFCCDLCVGAIHEVRHASA